MARIVHAGVVLAMLLGISGGCGSGEGAAAVSEETVQDRFLTGALQETGELFRFRETDTGKPPTKAGDFLKYEKGLPTGYKLINEGQIVPVWGAKIQEGASDRVLAYEKKTPESGGLVLMQDGTTVKSMTADEFKAAPKAQ